MPTTTTPHQLRKVAVAAVMAVTATSGLALGLAGAASAANHPPTRTALQLVVHQTHDIPTSSGFQAVGTETHQGALIGFYALTCQSATSPPLECGVGASFAQGEIFAQFSATGLTNGATLQGTIQGGTGAYHAVRGTLTGTLIDSTDARVTFNLSHP